MAQEIAAAGGIVSAADISSAAPVIQAPLTAQVRAMTRTSRQGAVNTVQWTALSKQLLSWLVDGALIWSLCTTSISDPNMRLHISCRGKCRCALLPQHSSILWLPVLRFLSSTSLTACNMQQGWWIMRLSIVGPHQGDSSVLLAQMLLQVSGAWAGVGNKAVDAPAPFQWSLCGRHPLAAGRCPSPHANILCWVRVPASHLSAVDCCTQPLRP